MLLQTYTSLNEPALLAAIIAMFGMLGAGVKFLDSVRVKQIEAEEADCAERVAAVAAGKDALITTMHERIMAERAEKNEWKAIALRSTTLTEQAVTTAADAKGGTH